MAIAVIHRSITQRRIFKNLLRPIEDSEAYYFDSASDCMEETGSTSITSLILQKKVLQEEDSRTGTDVSFQRLVRRSNALVISHQFTKDEAVALVQDGVADGLLLMPFTADAFYERLGTIAGVAP